MLAHGGIHGVIALGHHRDRQAVLVLLVGVQGDAVAFQRQVFAAQPDAGHVVVLFHPRGELAAPALGRRVEKGGEERQAEGEDFQAVTADETARRIVVRLVGDHPGAGGAAVHVHRLRHHREDAGGGVGHVVPADLAGGVGQPVGKHRGSGVEQQARRFDGVARHAYHPGLLPLDGALGVGVDHAVHLALGVVFDAQHHRLRPHLAIATGFGAGNVGVERRPLRAHLAALHAEADLLAGGAVVVGLGVDRHRPGEDLLVADPLGAGGQHLEGVVPGVIGHAGAGAGHAHVLLGLLVPGRHLFQGHRPVQQVGPGDVAVDAPHPEFEITEAQGDAGPVHGAAADALDDPGRQVGVVLGQVPVAGGDAFVEPGDLLEHRPLVVLDVLQRVPLARLEHHAANLLFGQRVGQRAAASAGADDHHDAIVVLGKSCHGVSLSCSCCRRREAPWLRAS